MYIYQNWKLKCRRRDKRSVSGIDCMKDMLEGIRSMPGKKSEKIREDVNIMENVQIMLHIADFLLKDNLITPEEKLRLKQLIKKGGSPT